MNSMKAGGLAIVASATLGAAMGVAATAQAATPAEVVKTYADIALAEYQDSLDTAKQLQTAIAALISAPSDTTLTAAKQAWIAARAPYQQTEVYRFGNAIVDDWEGKVNAWPLDEGLIDYVNRDSYGESSDENPFYAANVVANTSLTVGGTTVDATEITPELLGETLHEIDGVEANVATGYHAIEFLLWGQDLNGTGPGAGARPASDFDVANCTNGNCDRRGAYLQAAADLLVSDLTWMVGQWEDGGDAREAVVSDPAAGISALLTGMGSLSYGELAGERMKLGLILHDPEEEHDCFSDNTHHSHYYDALGIRNVFLGSYTRPDGTVVSGAGLKDILPEAEAAALGEALDSTVLKMQAIVDRAEGGESYDQQIGEGNAEGNATVQAAIDALVAQSKEVARAANSLNIADLAIEGSDSLDNPSAVQ